jgi:GAF domain-containing protein
MAFPISVSASTPAPTSMPAPTSAPVPTSARASTPTPPPEHDDFQQTVKDVTRFRALVMIIVVLGLVVLQPVAMQPVPAAVLGLAFVAYLLVLHFAVLPRHGSSQTMLAMILLDIGFITLALYFTGGVESILFTLFPISIMYSAVSLGYLGSFVAATAVTLCYGLLLVKTGTPASISGFLPLQMPFFYLLAGLSGYVVQMENLQRQQARTLREMLQLERGAKEILRVTRDLNSSLNREEILPRVATVACQVTGLSRCLFALMDEERGFITAEATNLPASSSGLEAIRELVGPLRDGSVSQIAMQTGKPVVVENARADSRMPPGLLPRLNVGSFLLLPLYHQDSFLGVMYLDDGEKKHSFGDTEIRVAQSFAEQAAIAIINARRHSEAQEQIQNLLAEMRSLAQKSTAPQRPARPPDLTLGDLELNAPMRRVMVRGRAVSLSWTEFELLTFLAANPDTAFSRETIFRKVWKQEYYISTNLVDVCVHRLRQKIERNPAEPRYVVTVHGVGYMFARLPPAGADAAAGITGGEPSPE